MLVGGGGERAESRYYVDASKRIISARIVERRRREHHLEMWRHDKERDGRSQYGGGGNQNCTEAT
jgi:hypothetical protein